MININIGELKHRIKICDIIQTENKNGFPIKETVVKYSPMAKVDDISYRTVLNGKDENISNTTKFIIRYKKNIVCDTDFIVFKDVTYKVINVDNIEFANKWLVIYATILNRDVN